MSEQDIYGHVIQSRRHLVESDNSLRIKAINEDIWVEYPLATKILMNVKYMMQLPRKTQSPCLLIHSDAGMGKTALYGKIKQLFGFARGEGACLATLTIRARHSTGHRIFCDDIVSSLTGGTYKSSRVPDEKLVAALSTRNVVGIALDEVNDLLLANRSDLAKNMKYIKELSGSPYCLLVVVIGTHGCNEAINSDAQFARRFTRIELPPWRDEQALRSFITAYVSTFPLKSTSGVGKPAIVKYLIQETDGVLDSIVRRLCNAASWAVLEEREEIDMELLKKGRELPL